jgi:hypothetical protein
MNYEEDIDITNEVDLVVSAYPVQDDDLDEELLAAGKNTHTSTTPGPRLCLPSFTPCYL